MMVIFVSECEKNALKKTRRVLDAFANRIGSHTWQTVITREGLSTVHTMLRKTASKSTAISCHWIRSRSRSECLWTVGNKNKFTAEGIVPVNLTEQSVAMTESFARHTPVIANLAAIAGFFHDLGKANQLFQAKLDARAGQKSSEPLRHEWVSMRLFQAFVDGKKDREWLTDLAHITHADEDRLMAKLGGYKDFSSADIPGPLTDLPEVAATVAWLIVTHHRLPQYPKHLDTPPTLSGIDGWKSVFEPCWNAPHSLSDQWTEIAIAQNWTFPYGTPFKSAFWQTHVSNAARQALTCDALLESDWQGNRFTRHLSRLALMLADHSVSSRPKDDNPITDRNYLAYANTDKDASSKKIKKQKLDEHNILVGKLSYQIACDIPGLKKKLPSLDKVPTLERKVDKALQQDFGWQDKAGKLARKIAEKTRSHGFFGISMASTGKGKTRANAKIMTGLCDQGECRFNVALGLRTLSIQTATALRKDLSLTEKEVALLVGSQAVMDLHAMDLQRLQSDEADKGSESKESLLKDEVTLITSDREASCEVAPWMNHDPQIAALLNAPVLVSTIDYLMPATEGVRGGRQIAPMLRLLTSDLVLDEPDDFSLDDLPALCRLVNFAGLLGARVLLSTATIPPSLALSLFDAYRAGRMDFNAANGQSDTLEEVCCAWFDECNEPVEALIKDTAQFETLHKGFVEKRVGQLGKQALALRKGQLVIPAICQGQSFAAAYAERIYRSMTELHQTQSVLLDNCRISIGLVRMANIDPLVAVAKQLVVRDAPDNTRMHYCVYHGQFPLIQRSMIEEQLDQALNRKDQKRWEKEAGLVEIIRQSRAENHIFVVLATSVAEVGRDHDYDWAIVEPSSQRSIIQLAGRVQRHRKQEPQNPNIHIVTKNFKAFRGKEQPVFEKPGFESHRLQYVDSDLTQLGLEKDISNITAIPRVIQPKTWSCTEDDPPVFLKFSDLEHVAHLVRLKGSKSQKDYAAMWWQKDVAWCAEMQRLQPFRKSALNQDYCLGISRQGNFIWRKKAPDIYPATFENTDDIAMSHEISVGNGVDFWQGFHPEADLENVIGKLSQQKGQSQQRVMEIYTHLSLTEINQDTSEQWHYHPQLGVHRPLKGDKQQ